MLSQVKSGLTFGLAELLNKQFAKAQESGKPMLSAESAQAIRQDILDAQAAYCRDKHIPMFMPYNGICSCGADLVAQYGETMRRTLISGCRSCCTSFVD